MALLSVRTYGDPCLREIASPVGEITDEIRQLIRNMIETMYESSGVGLAANQVGETIRLFVSDTDWTKDDDGKAAKRSPKVWINPQITWESVEDEEAAEGCLSIPGIEGEVFRPISVKVRYRDEKGVERERILEDLEARCAQHELDHLNGVLFIDRIPPAKRQLLAGRLNSLKHGLATAEK